jgi:hypothetical protein
MSGYRRYSRRARQSTRALTAKFAALAVVVTLLIGGLIAAQMAAGDDPALGPKAAASTKKASAKPASSTQTYGHGSSSGYSSGSGYSTQQSSPAPVTSSTS